MSGEQFDERDNAFIDDALQSANTPYGESILIKRFTGIADPGDPARGIQPRLGFTLTPAKAVVSSVAQQDVLYSGGLYQLGDIKINLKQKLNFVDTINQIGGRSEGDRIEYEGHEYRIVGKSHTHTLVNNERLFGYVFRKIGDA